MISSTQCSREVQQDKILKVWSVWRECVVLWPKLSPEEAKLRSLRVSDKWGNRESKNADYSFKRFIWEKEERVEIVAREGIIVKGTFRMKKNTIQKEPFSPARETCLHWHSPPEPGFWELKLVHAAFLWVFSLKSDISPFPQIPRFYLPSSIWAAQSKAGEK